MSEELLFEIGCEEIPAAFLPAALNALKTLMENEFTERRIGFGQIKTFGTPRRLVLFGYDIVRVQQDVTIKKTGPAKAIAYDDKGKPTKAAMGFARGQGIDVADLFIVKNERGEYICAERKEKGKETRSILPEILSRVISSIPFPKSMRWHDLDFRFARPLHWVVALFGGRLVPLSVGNIESGDTTFGHRFMAPGPVAVAGISSYIKEMEKACVEIDPEKRKKIISSNTEQLASEAGGKLDRDEKLLQEVTCLVEKPFPVLCSFEEEFLELPAEVLLTTMKKHQKYFPILSLKGSPMPCFVVVNNTDVVDPRIVIKGHERVLRARLSDARFFYAEDLKTSLDAMAEQLKHVMFQSKLGTSHEKVLRFQDLAVFVARSFVDPGIVPVVERAACLCKADLVSEMVGEFPELQGVMGREYAKKQGESNEIAEAIFEHYLPGFAGDRLPVTDAGAVVGIADRMDTIAGCFAVGLVPSGTADPYALRRQSLGIINIILGKKYRIPLAALINRALDMLKEKMCRERDEVYGQIADFFKGRLINLLSSRGFSHDVIDAVIAAGIDDLPDMVDRVEALQKMKGDPDFKSLAVSFKRVVNILSGTTSLKTDPALFERTQERDLCDKYLEIHDEVSSLMSEKLYVEALKMISTIRTVVDSFFDKVLVMAEDEKIRLNRLALLQEISSLFTDFADFSRIASEK